MKTFINHASFRGTIAALLVVALLFASGCGAKSSKGSTLSGKVTYRDQPLSGGSITLHTTDDKGQYKATISPDGSYAIGGVTPGEMVVTIETESIRGQTGVSYQAPPGHKAPDMGVPLAKYVPIPRAYGEMNSTPLHVTLKSGSNKQDFNLNDSGK